MLVQRALAQWRELLDQFCSPIPGERARDPDVMERALVIEQPQEQGADVRARPVLVPSEASDDTIRRALMLDLEHRALAGLIRRVELLGDDTIETGALEVIEPFGRERAVAGGRRQVDRCRGIGQNGFEAGAA